MELIQPLAAAAAAGGAVPPDREPRPQGAGVRDPGAVVALPRPRRHRRTGSRTSRRSRPSARRRRRRPPAAERAARACRTGPSSCRPTPPSLREFLRRILFEIPPGRHGADRPRTDQGDPRRAEAAAGPQGEAVAGRGDARPGPGGRRLRPRRAAAPGGVHGLARPERARRLPGGGDAHPARARRALARHDARQPTSCLRDRRKPHEPPTNTSPTAATSRRPSASGGGLAFVTAPPRGPADRPLPAGRRQARRWPTTPLPERRRCARSPTATTSGSAAPTGASTAARARRQPSAVGDAAAEPTRGLALLGGRPARGAGRRAGLIILATRTARCCRRSTCRKPGTCLAADPTGHWLVVGHGEGARSPSSRREGKAEFALERVGAGCTRAAVTALLFEPDELRFLSAGADDKLLSTHARGKLEPEDRGRGNNHDRAVTGHRLAARRPLLHRQPRQHASRAGRGRRRPGRSTHKDGVAKVVDLALVTVHSKPHLAVGLRGQHAPPLRARRRRQVRRADAPASTTPSPGRSTSWPRPTRRRARRPCRRWPSGDTAVVELIAEQMASDADHGLRLLAASCSATSNHPRGGQLLEKGLTHNDEAVRVAGLQRPAAARSARRPAAARPGPEGRARPTSAGWRCRRWRTLAGRDDQALARLTRRSTPRRSRCGRRPWRAWKRSYRADVARGDLIALGSQHADLRRLALVRLFQRQAADRRPGAGGPAPPTRGRRRRGPPHRVPAVAVHPAEAGRAAARARPGAGPAACRAGSDRPTDGTPAQRSAEPKPAADAVAGRSADA